MSSLATPTRGLDNRTKSRLNDEKVLRALHRFGWLPVRQISMYCWPNDKTPRSAQRSLQHLLAKKHVTFKPGPDGSRVYTLTPSGARRVREDLGLDAAVDTEFARRIEHSYEHRILANEVALWWERTQKDVAGAFYTEHEVATGRAPLRAAPQYMTRATGKIPDALLVMKAPVAGAAKEEKWLGWVEVERGYKNRVDQENMVAALSDVLALHKTRWAVGTNSVMKFAVVVCPMEAHEHRLVESLLDYLGSHKVDYDAAYVVNNTHIWRPSTGEGVAVREWMEDKPAMLALRDKCGMWWPPLKQ